MDINAEDIGMGLLMCFILYHKHGDENSFDSSKRTKGKGYSVMLFHTTVMPFKQLIPCLQAKYLYHNIRATGRVNGREDGPLAMHEG